MTENIQVALEAFLPGSLKRRYEPNPHCMTAEAELTPSQALDALLRKRLSATAAARITALYRWAAQHGSLEEPGIVRAAGVSFNPKPSRICQLLISEGQVTDGHSIEAALLAISSPSAEPPSGFERAGELAALVRDPVLSASNSDAFSVALAIALDTVRHLHMGDDPELRRRWLAASAALLSQNREISPRLSQLLEGAVSRQTEIAEERE